MINDLDSLLRRLAESPPDHGLDALGGDVSARIAERSAASRQTWGLRGAAALLITSAGIVVSASTAVATPEPPSAFAVWSSLAPSTLLDHGR